MKKNVLFILLLLLGSCSCDSEDIKRFDNIHKIEQCGIYYQYFNIDGHEYIQFYDYGYFEQVIHSPNCSCYNNTNYNKSRL